MEYVTIGASNRTSIPLRNAMLDDLRPVEERRIGKYTLFHFKLDESPENEYSLFVHWLANVIYYRLSEHWVDYLIKVHYSYFDREEQIPIRVRSLDLFHQGSNEIYETILDEITDFLEANQEMNVEGFVRFRLQKYWQSLRDSLDLSVDAFLIEKEYNEFVRLLRYFVELQEPKTGLVQVVLSGENGFQLLDHSGRVLQEDELDSMVAEVRHNDLDFEDLVISSLITVAPEKIVLHIDETTSLASTIGRVFEDRAEVCSGCRLCRKSTRSTQEKP